MEPASFQSIDHIHGIAGHVTKVFPGFERSVLLAKFHNLLGMVFPNALNSFKFGFVNSIQVQILCHRYSLRHDLSLAEVVRKTLAWQKPFRCALRSLAAAKILQEGWRIAAAN